MRLLPTNKPFSLKVDISYTNVRFRVDGYVLFPLEGQNDAYVHVKNTHRANIDTLKFDIQSLEKLGNVKKRGTAIVYSIADNTLQELVEINYKLLQSKNNKLEKYIQESGKIVISIGDIVEVKEVKKEKKPVIVSLIMEE